jgi:hypothetical protein
VGSVKVGDEGFLISLGSNIEDCGEGGGIGVGFGFGEDTGSIKTNGGTGVVAGSSVIARNEEVNSQQICF